jgi:hypothetical protein
MPNKIPELQLLKEHAEQLRLAELAVFLHNLGKCGEDFIYEWSREHRENHRTSPDCFYEQYAAGMLRRLFPTGKPIPTPPLKTVVENNANTVATVQAFKVDGADQALDQLRNLINKLSQHHFRIEVLVHYNTLDQLWDLILKLPKPFDDRPWVNPSKAGDPEPYRFGFFMEFHKGFVNDPQRKAAIGDNYRALAVCHQSHHLASGEEKKLEEEAKKLLLLQPANAISVISAFGKEKAKHDASKNKLKKYREQILQKLLQLKPGDGVTPKYWQEILAIAHDPFKDAFGDTQFPINDVRLWDLSHSTASFFKSAIAGKIVEVKDQRKPDLDPCFHKLLRWRYLTLSIDFFTFVTSSHRIIDVVSRFDYLQECYNRVQSLFEDTYCLANQIYRDENGLVFLIPDAKVWTWKDGGYDLQFLINAQFSRTADDHELPISDPQLLKNAEANLIDVVPHLDASVAISELERERTLSHALEQRKPVNSTDPQKLQALWEKLAKDEKYAEICPVCSLRPVGYDEAGVFHKTADERGICETCLHRRHGRAKKWHASRLAESIWIEEVADANGRAALVCGKFDLSKWLSGEMIEAMGKNASFARIQRCWETTEEFWREEVLGKTTPQALSVKSPRLRLYVENANEIDAELKAPYGAFELELKTARGPIVVNAVWIPQGADSHFLTADNLKNVAAALDPKRAKAHPVEVLKEKFAANTPVKINKPPHYSSPRESLLETRLRSSEPWADAEPFYPFIPILAQPETFMVIVPADRALILCEIIKQKYAEEMVKVRDRLPLHLGIVFFQKYVPAGAVLDAGRRLLQNAGLLKEGAWQIQDAIFYNGNGHAVATLQEACEIELHLHQPQTKRCTKTRIALCLDPKETDEKKKWDKIHPQLRRAGASNLETVWAGEAKNEPIYFAPSTFDYLFLDAASRRFESILDKEAQRRFHPLWGLKRSPRPYDLEAITHFCELWLFLKINPQLSTSKLYGIRDLLAKKIQDWHVFDEPEDDTARQAYEALVEDTLRKEFGYTNDHVYFASMKAAMMDGSFFDCLDLYLHILKEKL